MGLITHRNNALEINGTPGLARELSENGSNWLWAVTAVFGFCFVLMYAHSFIAKSGEKIFHYVHMFALLVGTISYFSMASGLGYVVVEQALEQDRGNPRQVFWVKYVYLLASFATVSVFLGLISSVSWATIAWWVILAWTWVIPYLISAYVETNYKWGFFIAGTVAYFLLAASVFLDGLKGAKRVDTTKSFILLAGWVQFLWLVYPLAFGLTDGSNFFGVTPMFIWFGALDVLMVPVLSIATIFLSKGWDYEKMNIYYTQHGSEDEGGENQGGEDQGGAGPEKDAPAPTGAEAA